MSDITKVPTRSGEAEVVWDSAAVLRKAGWATDAVEKASARRIYRSARRRCPVGEWERDLPARGGPEWKTREPGRLRDSIRMFDSRYKDGGYIVTVGDEKAFYASFVELGTPSLVGYRRPGKKPFTRTPIPEVKFLRGALEQERRIFRKRVKEIFTG